MTAPSRQRPSPAAKIHKPVRPRRKKSGKKPSSQCSSPAWTASDDRRSDSAVKKRTEKINLKIPWGSLCSHDRLLPEPEFFEISVRKTERIAPSQPAAGEPAALKTLSADNASSMHHPALFLQSNKTFFDRIFLLFYHTDLHFKSQWKKLLCFHSVSFYFCPSPAFSALSGRAAHRQKASLPARTGNLRSQTRSHPSPAAVFRLNFKKSLTFP